ncbi:MAG: hypothetical protein ACTSXP_14465 [Promethearchaeota archaeon]
MGTKLLIDCFKQIMAKSHPNLLPRKESFKNWSKNDRISIPGKIAGYDDDKTIVITLLTIFTIHNRQANYEPFLILTKNKQLFLVGARLSKHAGEISIRIAKNLAKMHDCHLVILDNNLITFNLLNLDKLKNEKNLQDISPDKLKPILEKYFIKYKQLSNDFNKAIRSIVSNAFEGDKS